MLKDPMSTDRRDKPPRRKKQGGRSDRQDKASTEQAILPDRRRGPDPRYIALRMLSKFLAPEAKPLKAHPPMPAAPRLPAGGAGFPRPGRSAPPVVASSAPPQVPFPTLAPTGGRLARPTAMEAIGRFLEMARAGGLAAHRRRRG